MLDALLSALSDSAFFEKRDFGTDFRDQLLVSDVPFACYARGAALWESGKYPAYPIYAICKTNTEDNPRFVPFNTGSLVISSAETGELLVHLLKTDPGKSPSLKLRPPSDQSSVPDAKSYSTRDFWRDFSVGEMRGGYGKYLAYMHAGDCRSAPFAFEMLPEKSHPPEPPFTKLLRTNGTPGNLEFGIRDAGFSQIPGLTPPNDIGATWSIGKSPVARNGSGSYPVKGTFRFAGNWSEDFVRMPLHFLVAVEGVRELDVNTLWIPRSKCLFQDGHYTGSFSFDLADLKGGFGGFSLNLYSGQPMKRDWIQSIPKVPMWFSEFAKA